MLLLFVLFGDIVGYKCVYVVGLVVFMLVLFGCLFVLMLLMLMVVCIV